jgi:hypothetical protein
MEYWVFPTEVIDSSNSIFCKATVCKMPILVCVPRVFLLAISQLSNQS